MPIFLAAQDGSMSERRVMREAGGQEVALRNQATYRDGMSARDRALRELVDVLHAETQSTSDARVVARTLEVYELEVWALARADGDPIYVFGDPTQVWPTAQAQTWLGRLFG